MISFPSSRILHRVSNMWWIFLILIFPPPQEVSASAEDIKYVDLYGNDVNTSGIWQRARDLAQDTEKLKKISYDAHMAVWPYYREGYEIETAFVTNEVVMFPGTNFTDINADLIAYKIVGLPKVTFYITKGLKPTCIYYVWKIKKAGPKWQIMNHVCDLTF